MKVCKLKYLKLKAQCPCLGSHFFFTQNNLWSFCSSVQWVCSHSEDGITSDAAFSPDDLPSKHRSRDQITSLFLWKMTPVVLLSFLQSTSGPLLTQSKDILIFDENKSPASSQKEILLSQTPNILQHAMQYFSLII